MESGRVGASTVSRSSARWLGLPSYRIDYFPYHASTFFSGGQQLVGEAQQFSAAIWGQRPNDTD
ncbi:hypothetical protein Mal33_08960 [Rosistilla oblonga]|uniref:Uncharacterized protein n=1 Tax=Rosistilla oblonga TaxID=2527990 RepID=A0A518IPB5_9BACT|nr:hypothetical protein Mal33_08960 [Rosistilla oblonga]